MVSYFYLRQLKGIAGLLVLSLCFPLFGNDPLLLKTIKQAERLFSEKLYHDALLFYSYSLDSSSKEELRTQLTLRLATCYLEENQPHTAFTLLSSLKTQRDHSHCFYFMSLAQRQLGDSPQALDLLMHCSLNQSSLYTTNLIALEKGYHLTCLGDLLKAQHIFKTILWQKNHPLPYYLAQLHLTQIELMTHQWKAALQTVEFLSYYLPDKHPLNIERVYLKGWIFLETHQYAQASLCFEKILTQVIDSKSASIAVLKGLIMSYLRQALLMESSSNELQLLLVNTETLLQQLLTHAPVEASYLLLSDFLLIKAKRLGDLQSYTHAQHLLNKQDLFSSQEGKQQALLKQAEAAPSYQERDKLYEQLSIYPYPQALLVKIWFFKGLNDFEEGLKNQKQLAIQLADAQFERAAQSFLRMIEIEQEINSRDVAFAFHYLTLTYAYQSQTEKIQQGWQSVIQLIENASLLSNFEYPQEIYCLAGWIALHLSESSQIQKARRFLQQSQHLSKDSTHWQVLSLKLEGLLCLQLKEWQQADLLFTRLIDTCSQSSLHGEAWFWLAHSAEQQQHLYLKKEYLQKVYSQYPQSFYAPIAYFNFHSYRDYMQGQHQAIKHLQMMPLLFPSHPLLIHAHYLIGLYHKKDLLSQEGRLIHRKDWTAAIESFQLAEDLWETLSEKKLISTMEIPYFTQVRYQAQLERALANLAIAQSSREGKKLIYLEYAEGVFKQLIKDFGTPLSPAQKILQHASSYPKTWREAEFKLAQIYMEKQCWSEADAILNTSLEHYQHAQITQGNGIMKVWVEKGKVAQKQKNDELALKAFIKAEKVNPEYTGLNSHEKLDLWIQQSLCYKTLNQLDHAMQLLSRVINDEVISPVRIKAMFLRAEIYEQQGRPELAIKQLQATALQKGEWAQKAKEKLEKIYE